MTFSFRCSFLCLILSLAIHTVGAQVVPTQVAQSENGLTKILYPEGGSFFQSSQANGAIQVTLPQGRKATRLKIHLEITSINPDRSYSLWVNGYVPTAGWRNYTAEVITSSSDHTLPIHFSVINTPNGERAAFWIGDTDFDWRGLKVHVVEVSASGVHPDIDYWDDGWEISVVSSMTANAVDPIASIEATAALPIAQSAAFIAQNQGDLSRIAFPGGASYSGLGQETGAIQIMLPVDYSKTLIRMRVEVYDERLGTGFSAWVSGNIDNSVGRWSEISAQILATELDFALPVRFGSGTNSTGALRTAVWIGETNTNWKDIKVHVAEILVGKFDFSIEEWKEGWEISIENNFMAGVDDGREILAPLSLPIAQQTTQLAQEAGTTARVTFPGGGIHAAALNDAGGIQVLLPSTVGVLTMIRMRINIYTRVPGESYSLWVAGMLQNNSSLSWTNTAAQVLTNAATRVLPVSFGDIEVNGEQRAAIWIGEETTAWSSLRLEVEEALLGSYINISTDDWKAGWDISVSDNFRTTGNIGEEISGPNTLPLSQSIWSSDPANNFIFTNEDQVAIGLSDPGAFRLAVDGDVKARRVKVTAEDWPDYVFAEDYELQDLDLVRAYIQKHGHLPGVPSKAEAERDGVFVNDMNVILLQKVEELTLYLLEENERIKSLNQALLEDRIATAKKLDDLQRQLQEVLDRTK